MRLFFYGTLMSGGRRGHVLSGLADPVGPGRIRGELHAVGCSFPALMPGDGVVHGEVWEVRSDCEAAALQITDSIEGYREHDPARSMYLREQVELLDGEGTVQVYRWNSRLEWLEGRIESGSWRVHLGAKDLAASGR